MEAIEYNRARYRDQAQIKAIQEAVGATADGVWGPKTVKAVAAWQQDQGLTPDGKVGPKTWEVMAHQIGDLPEDTDPGKLVPLHPVPGPVGKWGYDHCPLTYRVPDAHYTAVTGTGKFGAGLLRLVSGFENGTFSRGPDSWIALDTYSVGIAHWWADTAPDLFARIVRLCPTEAEWGWGEEAYRMLDRDWLARHFPAVRGKMPFNPRHAWLLAGFYEIARQPAVVRAMALEWFEDYVPPGLAEMEKRGWKLARTAAGLARVANSNGAGGMRYRLQKAEELEGSRATETEVMERLYMDPDLYDHPDRWEKLLEWEEFKGVLPEDFGVCDLDLSVEPVRVNGTKPRLRVG